MIESVELYLGPTNSGKTFQSVEFLIEKGYGTYSGPLRMLCREMYEKIKDRLGETKVGLVTGEEQINAEAPIICATPECATLTGDVLVLDEVHWIIDKNRGAHWTKLLALQGYKHYRICGALEAKDLLLKALSNIPESQIKFVDTQRRSKLHIEDPPKSWKDSYFFKNKKYDPNNISVIEAVE